MVCTSLLNSLTTRVPSVSQPSPCAPPALLPSSLPASALSRSASNPACAPAACAPYAAHRRLLLAGSARSKGRCNRFLKTHGCACDKKTDGAPKHVKETARNNFWARMNKKRARVDDQPPGAYYLPGPRGNGGAGPSNARF